MKSYSLAIILSVIGHSLLIWFVVWGWSASAEKTVIKKPVYIKATLVQLEQKAKPVAKVAEKKVEPPKVDESLKKKQEDAAKKKREAALQAQKKAQQKKAAEEKARKNQLAKKRAEEEKQKEAERKRKEQEQQKKLEEQRKKAALQKEIEEERQRELEKRINAEKARIEEAKQAANDAELVASYTGVIDEKVSANWSRPPSARNGMSALLRIQLVPTGRVIGVDIIESSGDAAFDRSARLAVNKAEIFPELQNLPSRVFEQSFRVFNLYFEPEDLRQ